ncbi:prepilin-type N-terminal cleavage/methylation domain-containing protein [Gimesia benthica]|uniref:Prepilin-type N-terminal cleavage/methylation domain-containing protein n=1 Tax=Gimesia benthica TaxID=2608982 RepID=A0A6I6ADV9_9PLAN|nr:prepilin-type N-terminal cleavage/methylation domain-containing protein [Gimesia benthica]QGQ24593.1 prepilin-type N-terminal cleavage/methylation domain-containing protein [Gimesia benthica]
MISIPTQKRTRAGLTLLEVLISLAIFLGALTALSQLIGIGSRAAVQAQLRTQAILKCQSKLAEALAGAQPLEAVSQAAFEDEENWKWSLDVQPGAYENMLQLTVSVLYSGAGESVTTSYQLTRQIRDPAMLLDAANTVESASDLTLEEQL